MDDNRLLLGILHDRQLYMALDYCTAGSIFKEPNVNLENINTEVFGDRFTEFISSLFEEFNLGKDDNLKLLICGLHFEGFNNERFDISLNNDFKRHIGDINEIQRLMMYKPLSGEKNPNSYIRFAYGANNYKFESAKVIEAFSGLLKEIINYPENERILEISASPNMDSKSLNHRAANINKKVNTVLRRRITLALSDYLYRKDYFSSNLYKKYNAQSTMYLFVAKILVHLELLLTNNSWLKVKNTSDRKTKYKNYNEFLIKHVSSIVNYSPKGE